MSQLIKILIKKQEGGFLPALFAFFVRRFISANSNVFSSKKYQ